ncbi:FxLYD domain-containing protein [Streptococcus sp. DD12]|uniref:FxLYD domain-containing protein n=1 Tax=Streptococcus sp. DD12 TaxID=1777880 RepID=UPI0007979F77|nr:FxLYD domain-containing protein [Streptococcus sp. DD12]KXT76836.1 hypothetical protein STRDD12_00241 [Streptococcus sp. DD12]
MKTKSLLLTTLAAIAVIILTACSSNNSKDEKIYYDDQFMTALSKGLEERWKYTDEDATAEDKASKKLYNTATQKELDQIEEYQDKSFKDSKLKEAAISYINALKDNQKVAETYGASSFDENWSKSYDARNEKLIAINNISKIKVSDKYQSTLDEVLASGKEVKQNSDNAQKVTDLIKSITFTKDEASSDEYLSSYTATVENTTGLTIANISLTVKLIDDQGVTVDEQSLFANNWTNGEKKRFEFTTDKTFAKTEISIDYQSIDK